MNGKGMFLVLLAIAFALPTALAGHAEEPAYCQLLKSRLDDGVGDMIASYADIHGVPVRDAFTLAAIESGFDQSQVSRVGAVGLFQVMPKDNTAGQECKKAGIIDDYAQLKDPEKNADCGLYYFSQSLDVCGSIEGAIRRYNGGKCDATNRETDNHVRKFNNYRHHCDFDYGVRDVRDLLAVIEVGVEVTEAPKGPVTQLNRNAGPLSPLTGKGTSPARGPVAPVVVPGVPASEIRVISTSAPRTLRSNPPREPNPEPAASPTRIPSFGESIIPPSTAPIVQADPANARTAPPLKTGFESGGYEPPRVAMGWVASSESAGARPRENRLSLPLPRAK